VTGSYNLFLGHNVFPMSSFFMYQDLETLNSGSLPQVFYNEVFKILD
jgi:hypothetical protein